jgi:hypothetical protein
MNNRVSRRPPKAYIALADELNQLQEGEPPRKEKKAQNNKQYHHPKDSEMALPGENKSEPSRQSTIFRFGKSLAASFNPSNWKIWSRTQENQMSDDKLNVEAQSKLERAYKEAKRQAPIQGNRLGEIGHNRMLNMGQMHGPSSESDKMNAFNARSIQQSTPEKRYGKVFANAPSTVSGGCQEGALSNYSIEPSLPSKKPSTLDLLVLHSNDSRASLTYGNADAPGILKHIPSRKELQVHQKLVKRVSDLEIKLETARLELAKALASPGSSQQMRNGKSRFVPGALASLPSESLLSGYTVHDVPDITDDSPSHIGRAITTDVRVDTATAESHAETQGLSGDDSPPTPPPKSNRDVLLSQVPRSTATGAEVAKSDVVKENHEAEINDDGSYDPQDNNKPKTTPSKKRKSINQGVAGDGGLYKPNESDEDDDASEPARRTPVKKIRGRRRKQIKTGTTNIRTTDPGDVAGKNDTKTETAQLLSTQSVPVSKAAKKVQEAETPKLVLKKRAPSEGQASRIPRKTSHNDTSDASTSVDKSTMSRSPAKMTVKATTHDMGKGFGMAPLLATPKGAGKLQKTMKPWTPKSTSDTPEVKKKTAPNGMGESEGEVEEITKEMSPSGESFQWSRDVF